MGKSEKRRVPATAACYSPFTTHHSLLGKVSAMNNTKVIGLRGVELGVRDLHQPAAFYSQFWGLEPVGGDGDTLRLRGNGTEHHVVTLRERPKPGLLGVHFAAADRDAVTALHAKAKAFGAAVLGELADLPREAGGGFRF